MQSTAGYCPLQIDRSHVQRNKQTISVVAETWASPATFQMQACMCCHVLPRWHKLFVDTLQRSPELGLVGIASSLSTVQKQLEFGRITYLCAMALMALESSRSRAVQSWECWT